MTSTNRPARELVRLLKPFARPSLKKSLFQIVNTIIPFAAVWLLMYLSLDVSYLLTLLLAVPAAGLLVRIFIFQHDCGHGSFFPSRKANDVFGFFLGVMTLTPYGYWKKTHSIHHKNAGNLDIRTFGDIRMLTVNEYQSRSRYLRFLYRVYRHPITLFVVGPVYQFILKHRLPVDAPLSWRREWRNVMLTNACLAGILFVAWLTIGLKAFLMVQLPISFLAGVAGVWLFYIQHNFEDTYWRNQPEWQFHKAGLEGSSFYDLHPFLHWWTGNIGVHHIHHLMPGIPNYNLMTCFKKFKELQRVTKLTLWESLRCTRHKLWDEERKQLIRFRDLKKQAA